MLIDPSSSRQANTDKTWKIYKKWARTEITYKETENKLRELAEEKIDKSSLERIPV